MTDLTSRLAVFYERTDAGIDTHRDDIGTLKERKNRRKAKVASYAKGNNHYFEFVSRVDVVMTLLEDGNISNVRFNEEYRVAQITFQTKMDNGIVRSCQHNNEVKIQNHFKRKKTVDRLRQLHAKKYDCFTYLKQDL